jgi:PAS domain S-box-containing protein
MPFNKFYKIRSMERFLGLDVSRENELQNIVTLAAEACQTPAAFLVFLSDGELIHQFKIGQLADEVSVDRSFWNMALQANEIKVIPDLSLNHELANNPMISGYPNLRFYAGVPLITYEGENIGSLYVLGQEAKPLSERRKRMLELLSRQAVTMVEFELSIGVLKEQFAEAKRSENKLRSFFESSRSSHLLIGRNMEVLTFNKTFFDIAYTVFGRAVTNGAPATEFIYAPYVEDFVANVQTALSGEIVQHERLLQLPGWNPRWSKLSYYPTYGSDGSIIGVSFNSTDITKRKRNEEKILEQNEALRKIAHLQSHELRKPVASILGLMQLLKMEENRSNPQVLEMMERAVQELDETIHQIVRNTETQIEADPFT